ncbi:MAG: HDOD domain-containing protein [Nitrospirae bacterium]|nr:HDOD domain-containing protein [Nitrospirota bacterium]
MKNSLKLYVQKITKLPTIPVIAQEILRLVSDDLASAGELEKIVEKDPAISAKILSVANSVFFGFTLPAGTISNAIIRIGFNNVKNIAFGISIMTILDERKGEKAISYERIFEHSAAAGVITRRLSKELGMNFSDELVVSGLLHDLGFLVMNRYFPDDYFRVLRAMEKKVPLLEAEKEVFGFTHADIGAWLTDKWQLPDSVHDVALYHHSPALAKRNIKNAAVIHIADYITTRDIVSATNTNPDYPFYPSSLEILGITDKDLKDIEENISRDIVF